MKSTLINEAKQMIEDAIAMDKAEAAREIARVRYENSAACYGGDGAWNGYGDEEESRYLTGEELHAHIAAMNPASPEPSFF